MECATSDPKQTETQPTTELIPTAIDKIGQQDTYWVASQWHSKDTGETENLQPEQWEMNLAIYVDGTARFRDIREGVFLMDDSCLDLVWERAQDGTYLFYSKLYPEPVLKGLWENETLYLDYYDITITMNEREIPKEIGQIYTPAELTGTWLQVYGETEGWQWEAMPIQSSSIVFRVTAYEGPLELRADIEELDSYGEMFDAVHDQKVSLLSSALYEGCENNHWSVRIGPESAKDENGYPTGTEFYATLLDYNTLVLQRYYTLDGYPAVSYQTYWRFPKLVTWRAPDYNELHYSNWACTGYTNAQGEDRSPPEEMTKLSLILHSDQTCLVSYDEDTTLRGTWQLENGGVLLLRGDDDTFWFGGAISAYSVETTYEISDVYEMALYYNGGILRLTMTGYG